MNKNTLNINILRNNDKVRNNEYTNLPVNNDIHFKTLTTLNNIHFDIETNKFKVFLIATKLIIKSFIKFAVRTEKSPLIDMIKCFTFTISTLGLLSLFLMDKDKLVFALPALLFILILMMDHLRKYGELLKVLLYLLRLKLRYIMKMEI